MGAATEIPGNWEQAGEILFHKENYSPHTIVSESFHITAAYKNHME